MEIELILTGKRHRDIILMELKKHSGGKIVKEWSGNGLPIIVGNQFGADEVQKKCRREKRPYVYIDHGYFTRGYDKGVFRFCVSHYHTTDWRPSDRPYPKPAEWKEGKNVVILPPAPMVRDIYRCHNWLKETIDTLTFHTKRSIIVKEKSKGSLQEVLKDAHCVVSYGTVGEVEALLAGVPVFTTLGPSLPVALTDFSKVETPTRPDRSEWLSSLAGAEWHLSELDRAWERISGYLDICRTSNSSSELA